MKTLRRFAPRLGAIVLAVTLPLALDTCESNSGPTASATIEITPATGVSFNAIGTQQQLAAVVKNVNGSPVSNAPVVWTTSDVAVVTVGSTGIATSVANGSAQITATSGTATASVPVTVAQTASLLVKVSGDLQTDTVDQTLPQPIVLRVRDAAAHGVPGATVTFAPAVGSGSVGTPSVITDASGQAQTTWTIGQTAGNQTLNATVGTLSALSFTATATAGIPASVAKQAGDGQTGVTGQPVTVRPAVIVKDAFNNPKAGAAVLFAVTAPNGSVTGGSQTTNALGIATVTSWTLGNAGTDTLTATVTGSGITGNPAIFTATSQAGLIAAYVGDNQVGLVGYPVNVRPAVRVTTGASIPVSGAAVTFAVASGGGTLTGAATTTNVNGIAQVGSWTLGSGPATNTMTATVTGSGISGNPVTFADTGVAANFTIDIQYFGPPPTAGEQAAFTSAVTKWQSIIYRHFGPATPVMDAAGDCGAGEPAINQVITDVLILAKFDSIDGPSQILGQAGPCFIRLANAQTLVGVMVFDSADAAGLIGSGSLDRVVLHEMGHVLGLGTLWNQNPNACLQLSSSPPGTILDTYFSCAKGRAAFDSVGGTSYTGGGSSPPAGNKVPVENCGTSPYLFPACGGGTVNGHWREVVLGNELMTGYLNGGSNPLSIVTVAAQGDLGYTVNYAGGDAYSHIFTAPPAGGAPSLFLGNDVRRGPIYVVNGGGTVIRVIRNP